VGYLVRQFLVEKDAFSEPAYLAEGMQEFYLNFVDQLAHNEIDPWVREAAELITMQTAIEENGFRSWLTSSVFNNRTFAWRPQAMQDIVAAYELLGALEQAKIFSAVAHRLEDVPPNDRRGILNYMGYERAPEYPDLEPLKQWLEEQFSKLWELDEKTGNPAHIMAERARREGLVKPASESRIEKEVERIYAKSPTYRVWEREREQRIEKARPIHLKQREIVAELVRLAGLDSNLDSRGNGANEVAGAPGRTYHYVFRMPDDPPGVYPRKVAYFEDGDRGVLATYPGGQRLAEVSIEPGSTEYGTLW
jgi:hypothetical protein